MPREQERVTFFVEVVLESDSGRRQARISDLSVGGCFIDSIANISEGESVTFDLKHPNGEEMEFTGQVTYLLPSVGFGVRFTDMQEEQRTFVERIVKTLGG